MIEDFFVTKTFALVGASNKKGSFGEAAYTTLKQRGYEIYPVNPKYSDIAGDRCYKSFSDLPPGVESAVFVLPPSAAQQAVSDAKVAGIKRIWFQQGAKYGAAINAARQAGMDVVCKKCILMHAQPVSGVHAFHRFLAKLFGRV